MPISKPALVTRAIVGSVVSCLLCLPSACSLEGGEVERGAAALDTCDETTPCPQGQECWLDYQECRPAGDCMSLPRACGEGAVCVHVDPGVAPFVPPEANEDEPEPPLPDRFRPLPLDTQSTDPPRTSVCVPSNPPAGHCAIGPGGGCESDACETCVNHACVSACAEHQYCDLDGRCLNEPYVPPAPAPQTQALPGHCSDASRDGCGGRVVGAICTTTGSEAGVCVPDDPDSSYLAPGVCLCRERVPAR